MTQTHCLDLTSVCCGSGGGGRRARRVRQRRPARAASMAAEETGEVESAQQGLREFWDEKRNDTGGLLFID
jgi:hypothetical protein